MGGEPIQIPDIIQELLSESWLFIIEKLAKRTAEMHNTLASIDRDPNFAPEPYTTLYQRSLYQSMSDLAKRSMILLHKVIPIIPEDQRALASQLLDREKDIHKLLDPIKTEKITTIKIRNHGNFHLGNVLYTGDDVVIIDFKGEPARFSSERKTKHSVYKDLACMCRSFHYAACNVLMFNAAIGKKDSKALEPWGELWSFYSGTHFINEYNEITTKYMLHDLLEARHRELLLRCYKFNRAIYELNYELSYRPDWATIPMKGILQLIES